MDDFSLYYPLGIRHILDWEGYDHILFIMVLCSSYIFSDWKKILTLVTAFTLGHSLTLALSVLHLISIPGPLVEFLIPITIAVTAGLNLLRAFPSSLAGISKNPTRVHSHSSLSNYFLALCFGFIHGMGFASALKSLLGKEASIWIPLVSFNLGLETGQLVVVLVVLSLSYWSLKAFRLSQQHWNALLSGIIFLFAILLAYIRFKTTNYFHLGN